MTEPTVGFSGGSRRCTLLSATSAIKDQRDGALVVVVVARQVQRNAEGYETDIISLNPFFYSCLGLGL